MGPSSFAETRNSVTPPRLLIRSQIFFRPPQWGHRRHLPSRRGKRARRRRHRQRLHGTAMKFGNRAECWRRSRVSSIGQHEPPRRDHCASMPGPGKRRERKPHCPSLRSSESDRETFRFVFPRRHPSKMGSVDATRQCRIGDVSKSFWRSEPRRRVSPVPAQIKQPPCGPPYPQPPEYQNALCRCWQQ
jgi:hypothetical protein